MSSAGLPDIDAEEPWLEPDPPIPKGRPVALKFPGTHPRFGKDIDPHTRTPEYRCTRCGDECTRDDLTVVRVSFHHMGVAGKRKGSRTTAWLCPACLEGDPVFKMPRRHGAFMTNPADPKEHS